MITTSKLSISIRDCSGALIAQGNCRSRATIKSAVRRIYQQATQRDVVVGACEVMGADGNQWRMELHFRKSRGLDQTVIVWAE